MRRCDIDIHNRGMMHACPRSRCRCSPLGTRGAFPQCGGYFRSSLISVLILVNKKGFLLSTIPLLKKPLNILDSCRGARDVVCRLQTVETSSRLFLFVASLLICHVGQNLEGGGGGDATHDARDHTSQNSIYANTNTTQSMKELLIPDKQKQKHKRSKQTERKK